MKSKVCEACGNGIRIKRGYFVRVYEEPPVKHIYHLFCFKAKIIDERRRRTKEQDEKKESAIRQKIEEVKNQWQNCV